MQIVELELPHNNFYNLANGEVIFDEEKGINHEAKSLVAYWYDEAPEDPFTKNQAFSEQYNAFYHSLDTMALLQLTDSMKKFLLEYESDTWIAFVITSTENGCGPYEEIVFLVLDAGSTEYAAGENN